MHPTVTLYLAAAQVPEGGLIPPRLLRAYITLARRQQPAIPPELTDYVAAHYVEARGQEAAELGERGAYITPRTLMSILRLSQVRGAGVLLLRMCVEGGG
jgi:DNA replicative helicase MCM subunit Mcm2 (Cdc46/Mcm family)